MPLNIGNPLDYQGTGYDTSICECPACQAELAPFDLILHPTHKAECPYCGYTAPEKHFINYEEE